MGPGEGSEESAANSVSCGVLAPGMCEAVSSGEKQLTFAETLAIAYPGASIALANGTVATQCVGCIVAPLAQLGQRIASLPIVQRLLSSPAAQRVATAGRGVADKTNRFAHWLGRPLNLRNALTDRAALLGQRAAQTAQGAKDGLGNITHAAGLRAEQALRLGERWLGDKYREIAPGLWRSADGLRQFRMRDVDLAGAHGKTGSHVHFEALNNAGKVIENLHVPLIGN